MCEAGEILTPEKATILVSWFFQKISRLKSVNLIKFKLCTKYCGIGNQITNEVGRETVQ